MKENRSQFFDIRKKTSEWLDKNYVKNYTINDDLSVDVNGDVIIFHRKLKVIPIKFGKVTGKFLCNDNQLISLAGSPEFVGGNFWCENNKLTNLTGSPETVGGDFDCSDNQIISLIGAPKTVGSYFGGYFSCVGNPLISLVEMVNCNFNGSVLFDIDENNFLQNELIQILKKYYNNKHHHYVLAYNEFSDIIKSQIEKESLQQKLNKSKLNKSENKFI